jgi:DASS family divalent anion:Na+ symporter
LSREFLTIAKPGHLVKTESRTAQVKLHWLVVAPEFSVRPRALLIFAAALTAGYAIWRLPPPDGMDPRGIYFLATMVVAVALWVSEAIEEFIVGLLLLFAWVVLGIVPSKVALSGFATNAWFFTIGALGIAAAIGNTSLLRRLALKLVIWVPIRCQKTYAFCLLSAGMFSGPLLPTGKARAAVAVPVSQAITEVAGFGARSNGSAAISLAAFVGFSQMSFMFLTGGEHCLIAWNFLPPAHKSEFGWMTWFLAALPAAVCIIVVMFFSIQFLLPLSAEEKERLAARPVESSVGNIGPISTKEWITLTVLILTVAGWLTAPLHGIDEAWIALGALLVFLLLRVLDGEAFKKKLDWGLILFFGVLNSLTAVAHHLRVDESLRTLSESFLNGFVGSALGFLLVVFVMVSFMRFFLRKAPAAALSAVTLLPFSQSVGVHPGVLIIAAIMIGECFLLSYQDGPYQIAYGSANGTAFSPAQARKVLAAKYVATLVALVVSVPYWQFLGLIH